jgi:hypothetical protein
MRADLAPVAIPAYLPTRGLGFCRKREACSSTHCQGLSSVPLWPGPPYLFVRTE